MSKKRQAKRRAKAKARARARVQLDAPDSRPSITEEELKAALDDVAVCCALRLLRLAPELLALDKDTPAAVIEDVKYAVRHPPPPPPPEWLALYQAVKQEEQEEAQAQGG